MYITLTDAEVYAAMTEWLNTHKFKDAVRVKGVLLGTRIVVGKFKPETTQDDINVINISYVCDELAGTE